MLATIKRVVGLAILAFSLAEVSGPIKLLDWIARWSLASDLIQVVGRHLPGTATVIVVSWIGIVVGIALLLPARARQVFGPRKLSLHDAALFMLEHLEGRGLADDEVLPTDGQDKMSHFTEILLLRAVEGKLLLYGKRRPSRVECVIDRQTIKGLHVRPDGLLAAQGAADRTVIDDPRLNRRDVNRVAKDRGDLIERINAGGL